MGCMVHPVTHFFLIFDSYAMLSYSFMKLFLALAATAPGLETPSYTR